MVLKNCARDQIIVIPGHIIIDNFWISNFKRKTVDTKVVNIDVLKKICENFTLQNSIIILTRNNIKYVGIHYLES